MFGREKEKTNTKGTSNLAGVLNRLAAAHERNTLFAKLNSREPLAPALNPFIDSVNEELEYQKIRTQTINNAVRSGLWSMKIKSDFSVAYAIWSDNFRKMIGFHDESDFPNTVEDGVRGFIRMMRTRRSKRFPAAFVISVAIRPTM